MKHYFSAQTGGFYCDYNAIIPDDAVEVHEDLKIEILEKQATGQYFIAVDDKGLPFACESPKITPEQEKEEWRKTATISNAQARKNLAAIGKFDAVDAKIQTLPKSHPMCIDWEYSTDFHRNNIVLIEFCTKELKLTDEQIDKLFIVQ